MPLVLHLLRHGQTAASRDGVQCGRRSDPPLTPEGREMAAAAARAFAGRGFAAIWASPQRRAQETAGPIAAAAGLDIRIDPDLAEIDYGSWEGKTMAQAIAEDANAAHAWLADPATHAPPGGETALAVAARAVAALGRIRGAHSEGDVLVVSHKTTIRLLVCALLGIDPARYRKRLACPVCSRTTITLTADGPRLDAFADRSHLDERLRTLADS